MRPESPERCDGRLHDDLRTGRAAPGGVLLVDDHVPLAERLLVNNLIDRYAIGSATPGLVTAEDGSLTLHISAHSPGPEAEANWLPAPEGPFWMVLRNYGRGRASSTAPTTCRRARRGVTPPNALIWRSKAA